MSSSGFKSKTAVATLILLLILPVLSILSISPVLCETKITSINPPEGPVGTNVTVVGVIDTAGGRYQIWYDVNQNGYPFDEGELMMEGKCASGSKNVTAFFTIPPSAKGGHIVALKDKTAGTSATDTFTVKTGYALSLSTDYVQEGGSITITLSITGGYADEDYNFTVTVTDPDGHGYEAALTFTTDSLGSGKGSVAYPDDFSGGAHTVKVGTYNVTVDQVAPDRVSSVASGRFKVGLTDKAKYKRFETVSIVGYGYKPKEDVKVNITDPSNVSVKGYPKTVPADKDGRVTDSWTIPKNATKGIYTVSLKGEESNKTDKQTFEVTPAVLTVTITKQPAGSYIRTDTASMKFKIQYPDGSYYTAGDLGRITVSVYFKGNRLENFTLNKNDFNTTTKEWTAKWKIPSNAGLGDYKFVIEAGDITDTVANPNTGPEKNVESEIFTVSAAVLTVTITKQPTGLNDLGWWRRTEDATMKFKIQYPDGSYYTADDLGRITVSVYFKGNRLGSFTLNKDDFNTTTKEWTAKWKIPSNAGLGDYKFVIEAGDITDTVGNTGPAADVSSISFAVVEPTITLNPTVGLAGTEVTVTGRYFTPGEKITLLLDTHDVTPTPAPKVKGDGTFSATFLVPKVGEGLYTVTAKDESGFRAEASFYVTWPWIGDILQHLQDIEKKLDVGGSFYTFVDERFTSISGTLSNMVTEYLSPILKGVNDIKALLEDEAFGLSKIYEKVEDTYNYIIGVETGFPKVLDAIDSAKEEIIEAMPTLNLTSVLEAIDTLEAKLDDALPALIDAVSKLEVKLDLLVVDADESGVPDFIEEIDAIKAKLDDALPKLDAIKVAVDAIKLKTDTINWADITAIKAVVDAIEDKLDALTVAQAKSGSGSTTFTASGLKVIYEGSKVGTVTVSLKTTGVGSGERLVIRYYTDPSNPTVYIEKTVTSGTNTAGWTDTAAAWKVEIVYTWRSGTDTVYWGYSAIYPQ